MCFCIILLLKRIKTNVTCSYTSWKQEILYARCLSSAHRPARRNLYSENVTANTIAYTQVIFNCWQLINSWKFDYYRNDVRWRKKKCFNSKNHHGRGVTQKSPLLDMRSRSHSHTEKYLNFECKQRQVWTDEEKPATTCGHINVKQMSMHHSHARELTRTQSEHNKIEKTTEKKFLFPKSPSFTKMDSNVNFIGRIPSQVSDPRTLVLLHTKLLLSSLILVIVRTNELIDCFTLYCPTPLNKILQEVKINKQKLNIMCKVLIKLNAVTTAIIKADQV